MPARERVEAGAQHIVAGGAAQAGVESEGCFVADCFLTRLEIGVVEFPIQQRLEMREFELLDVFAVRHNDATDFRHAGGGVENGFDGLPDGGCDHGPK